MSDQDQYRDKIAALVDQIGDYPYSTADEILAVRCHKLSLWSSRGVRELDNVTNEETR